MLSWILAILLGIVLFYGASFLAIGLAMMVGYFCYAVFMIAIAILSVPFYILRFIFNLGLKLWRNHQITKRLNLEATKHQSIIILKRPKK